jgi:hypothetical protein
LVLVCWLNLHQVAKEPINTSLAVELFELQPIGASSVGVCEQMQRNLQADNPTLVPQIDSRKPAIQEILQPVPINIMQNFVTIVFLFLCAK